MTSSKQPEGKPATRTITIHLPEDVYREVVTAATVKKISGNAFGVFDAFTLRLVQLMEDGVAEHTFQLNKKGK